MEKISYKELGKATTIGELRDLIKDYDDEHSFGFRNQPIQYLHELKIKDKTFIVFDEPNLNT